MRVLVIAVILAASVGAASAQTPAKGPFLTTINKGWDSIKRHVAGSAAAMPAADYAFKPTPKVRSFAEILGHLANEHYAICSSVKGEANPNAKDFEKTTSKNEMLKALNDSIAYCDPVYAGMTDARAVEKVKIFDSDDTRYGGLAVNVTHDSEHYGNLVTYLRLKDIVPPSSQPTP